MRQFPIECIPANWHSANCYAIHGQEGDYYFDPGVNFDKERDKNCRRIFYTHGHFDHLGPLEDWQEGTKAPFGLAKEDWPLLLDPQDNCSALFRMPRIYEEKPDFSFEDGELISLEEGLFVRVWLMPGHTKGSAIFLVCDGDLAQADRATPICLIVGDLVFEYSVGRSDLTSGSSEDLRASLDRLRELSAAWADDLVVLPGHGSAFSVATLRRNPFLQENGILP